MYLIQRLNEDQTTDYFGPFPSKERAEEYAQSFGTCISFDILNLIVPNCVSVKVNY